ncbi:hypothetical protein BJ912DRAFT_995493 [Pholiota molesta]|nr:hypothetical protein BJ912DRAFT_995493 [Pholiota molesta]
MTIPDPLGMSPMSRIPYDVLREIFIHCLPRYRLRVPQPNPMMAPMLLCHICSAWRTVALGSPTLWSHLSYRLAITDANSDQFDRQYNDWKFLKHQLAFLAWWRRNQGTAPLYLCLNITWRRDDPSELDIEPDAGKTASLFRYIASARYLESEEFLWCILHEWNGVHGQEVYPHAHTLVKSYHESFDFFYSTQSLLPPTLRHLSLHEDVLFDHFTIPNSWSKLTRIALDGVVLPLDILLSFLHSVPDLRWAHLDISLSSGTHTPRAPRTLPHLHTLHLLLRAVPPAAALPAPLRTVFAALHLPALHTLALGAAHAAWRTRAAAPELAAVLRAAPAVATLTLPTCFLALDAPSPSPRRLSAAPREDAAPFWADAPGLRHLRFRVQPVRGGSGGGGGADGAAAHKTRDAVLHNIFRGDNRWLRLDAPACPIRRITLLDTRGGAEAEQGAGRSGDAVRADVRACAEKARGVDVVFEDGAFDGADARQAAGAWNEWGPNLQR